MSAKTARHSRQANAPERVIFAPVHPRTAFEETLGRLENAIKLGLLTPGSRLPAERDLCTQLNVSRSTLRQALTTLTELGYVHAIRGRGGGTFVVDELPRTQPDVATLAAWRDTCDERLGVELGATVLASKQADGQSLAALRLLAESMEATDNFGRYCQLDRQFHIAIASLTQNQRLTVAATRIQAATHDLLAAVEAAGNSTKRADQDHRELLTALSVNDEEGALKTMYRHLEQTTVMFERTFSPQSARR